MDKQKQKIRWVSTYTHKLTQNEEEEEKKQRCNERLRCTAYNMYMNINPNQTKHKPHLL